MCDELKADAERYRKLKKVVEVEKRLAGVCHAMTVCHLAISFPSDKDIIDFDYVVDNLEIKEKEDV